MSLEFLTPAEGVVDFVLLNIAGQDGYLYTTASTPTSTVKNLLYISPTGAATYLGSDSYDKISVVRIDNQIFRLFWNVPNSSTIYYRDFNISTLSLSSALPLSISGQDVFVRRFNDTFFMTYIFNQNLHLARSFDGLYWEFVQVISSDSRFSLRRSEFNLIRRSNGFDFQIAEVREFRTELVSAESASSKSLLAFCDARAKIRQNAAAGASFTLASNPLGTNIRQDTFVEFIEGLIGGHASPFISDIVRPPPPPEINVTDTSEGLIGGHGNPLIVNVTRPPPPIEETVSDTNEGLIGGHGDPLIISVTRN